MTPEINRQQTQAPIMNSLNIAELDHLALIRISGDDAAAFLQGQLTNDVNQLDQSWQYSGYCNPKGRLLALLRIWKQADGFYALLPKELVEPITKRLTMFVMRSKVGIEELDHAQIMGFQSAPDLHAVNPQLADTAKQASAGKLLVHDESFALISNKASIYVSLATGDLTTSENYDWQFENLRAGNPEVTGTSSEMFVPQMLNLDLLNGINFKKGCYTGQEIVARMHYLGKLKQRMFLCDVQGEGQSGSLPGEKIYTDNELSKSSGTLVSIKGGSALAVLRLSELTSDHFLASGEVLVPLKTQPWEIPELNTDA